MPLVQLVLVSQSYIALLPLSWRFWDVNRKLSTSSSFQSCFLHLSFFLQKNITLTQRQRFVLNCCLPMTTFPAMFLLLPQCILYKCFPFSFQSKVSHFSQAYKVIYQRSSCVSLIETKQTFIRTVCSCQSYVRNKQSLWNIPIIKYYKCQWKDTSLHFCLQTSKCRKACGIYDDILQ